MQRIYRRKKGAKPLRNDEDVMRRSLLKAMGKQMQIGSGNEEFVKEKWVLIKCYSAHYDMVHPSESGTIGWTDDYDIDSFKVIRCIEFIFEIRIFKF